MSMRRPKSRSRLCGFTLVELLVAITILAIVAVLGWRGLDSIARARVALTADLEQTRGLQLAFAQMQRDASQVVDLDTIPDRLPIMVEPNRMILVRHVFIENQPTRIQLVAYQLEGGVLSRRESAATRDLKALDNLWLSVTSEADGAPRVALQSKVAAMTVRIWLNDGAGWRVPGVDVVSSGSANAGADASLTVPTGIEVSLQLQGHPGNLIKTFLLGPV